MTSLQNLCLRLRANRWTTTNCCSTCVNRMNPFSAIQDSSTLNSSSSNVSLTLFLLFQTLKLLSNSSSDRTLYSPTTRGNPRSEEFCLQHLILLRSLQNFSIYFGQKDFPERLEKVHLLISKEFKYFI